MGKGSLCMTVGFFFIALSGAFLKTASASSSVVWAVYIAYSFACLIQIGCIYREGLRFLKTNIIWGYVARISFGLLATLLYIASLNLIPFLNATLLYNTAPLFIPLFAILLWGARISGKVWISLGLGFFGVFLILKPDLASLAKWGNLISLAAGISQALAFIYLKMLTRTEPVGRLILYYYFFSSCFLTPFVFLFWEAPPLDSVGWALCGGLAAFLSQFFVVKAYKYADASHVGAFQYTAVVFSGIIGWIVWNQVPSYHAILGTLFVILGGASALIFYQPKPPAPHQQ